MNTKLSSYLKSYLKFLSRNKGYTAIDLFGLAISLMFVLMIAVYTWQEFSTDRFHTKRDQLYLFATNKGVSFSHPIAQSLKGHYPEIEGVCSIVTRIQPNTPAEAEGNKIGGNVMFADSTFFQFFSFDVLQGNAKEALIPTNAAVVTREFALNLYGTEQVIGKPLTLMDSLHYTISAVVKDLDHSCIPSADIILPLSIVGKINSAYDPSNTQNYGMAISFAQVHKGIDPNLRAGEMQAWLKGTNRVFETGRAGELQFVPLTDFYFSNLDSNGFLQTGDRRFVLVLMSVGILILCFAILNYINLTVAQAGFRAKEMATRRLLGSSRGELFWRLMSESTLMCFVAFVLSLLIVFYLAPFAESLLQTHLDLSVLFSWQWILIAILGIFAVGGLAGWLPSVVISSAKPIEIVRGTLRVKTKMTYSKVFITFQSFITITMLSCSLVMISQLYHLIHAPIGYNTKNLYAVMTAFNTPAQTETFVNKLRQIGGINRVGLTQGLPFFGADNSGCNYLDGGVKKNIHFYKYPMDRTCFEMLGLKIIQDNQLANPEWYLNEEALRQMNLRPDAPTFTLEDQAPQSIAGVIADFCHGNITQGTKPVMLRFMKPGEQAYMVVAELQGNTITLVEQIRKAYSEATGGVELNGGFLDQKLEQSFQPQIRLTKIVGVFTFIAIVISLLGLLAMSTYFIQQRSMEVAIRKVFGSSNAQVLFQLVKSFMIYVGIAFLFAMPVADYFMQEWLADYNYRIDLGYGIYVTAGLFCLIISLCTVFIQSYKAATANPKETMKNL